MNAATAFTGTDSAARFMTMKLLEPMPTCAAPAATSWGTLVPGPAWNDGHVESHAWRIRRSAMAS